MVVVSVDRWRIIGVLIGQIWCHETPEAMDLSHCRYSTFQGNHLWSQVEGWDQRSFPVLGKEYSSGLPWIEMDVSDVSDGQVQNPSSPGAARSWRVKS